jgi:trigger factor
VYRVIPGLSTPAPGFAEQLVGMKRDEDKEFKLKLPENYPDGELAGKEVMFKVKVVEVKKEQLPEINDDLAKGVAPDIKTLDSLRKRIAADLKKRAEEKARLEHEERVIDAVVSKSEVKFPLILMDMEVDRMIDQELRRWQMAAKSREEYIEKLKGASEEELRYEFEPYANQRVTKSLVLGEVVKAEKIEVGDAEIDAKIERMTENIGPKKEEQQKFLNNPQSRQQIKQMLLTQKTVQRLVEIAKGSGKEIKKGKKEAK